MSKINFKRAALDADGNINWNVTDATGSVLGHITARRTSAAVKTTSYNQADALNGQSQNFMSVRDAADWIAAQVPAAVTEPDAVAAA